MKHAASNMTGIALPLRFRPWMAVLWIGIPLSSGCDGSSPDVIGAQVSSGSNYSAVPEVPDRPPLDMQHLRSSNIYENICAIGNPFIVSGWDLDADTRFLYFVGPFIDSAESSKPKVYPYLYNAIDSPERERVTTTHMLDSIDNQKFSPKPEELQRFLLPSLTAVESNPKKIEQRLGKPDVVRKLKKSGRTRLVYTRRICFGDKLLAGMYFDVADGVVVKAKGVEHPERLKWVASGNRPPSPDIRATYYLDQEPLTDSPQDIAIGFVVRRSNGDLTGAKQLMSDTDISDWQLEEVTQSSLIENSINYGTLTYQTTRYELDRTEIIVTYKTDKDDILVKENYQLRKEGDKWRIVTWSDSMKTRTTY